jgi:hypothetical protein
LRPNRRWHFSRHGGNSWPMKNVEHQWILVADQKAETEKEGWSTKQNMKLRKARYDFDQGTHVMATFKVAEDWHQIWTKRKEYPDQPAPYFSLSLTEKSALYDKAQNPAAPNYKGRKRNNK